MRPLAKHTLSAFETALGWIVLVGSGTTLRQVVFGCTSRRDALAAVDRAMASGAQQEDWYPALARRIEEYAEGAPVDFADIELDLADMTAFQRRVIKHCRAIPYGQVRTYGQLAAAAGSARAARAVGSTMAIVRYPLIVPCHRVMRAGAHGSFDAPPGERTRRRLRALEQLSLAAQERLRSRAMVMTR